jgi:MFS transporter, SP family, arabinose:H+ symporter
MLMSWTRLKMDKIEQPNFSYVVLLGATAALGGLLFGFDIAIITGAGPFLEKHFQLDQLALGWAFSSLLFGCVLGSATAGWISDKLGRRSPLLWVAALFTLTSLATGGATNFDLFILARFLGGVAVGAVSVLAPLYVSEVSPAVIRGRMGALYQLAIVVGVLASFCINYLLRNTGDWNWRWMFISGAVPSIVFFLLMWRAPETPRYLVKAGKKAEALSILTRIEGKGPAEVECAEIAASLAGKTAAWADLNAPGTRRAVRVSFVLAILIQVSGVNTVIDYAPRIFQSAGWTIDSALLSTFFVGTINLVFTLGSFWVIDRIGRKPCYIVGSIGMAVALSGLFVAVLTGQFTGVKVLVCVLLYLAFFASCIGPVFWTLVPEIFPNRVRGEAMTVPVLTQWLANAVVVLFFPWVFSEVGKAVTFGFLALMCICQALFTWRFLPETKGRTLEEIEGFWILRPGDRLRVGEVSSTSQIGPN